jgi:hypothetical protein
MRARCIFPGVAPKELAPAGHTAAGFAMADPAARLMLQTGTLHGELWICEGVPDFLQAATSWGDSADVAVLGIFSGSWTTRLAARIPDGTCVIIATHADSAGEVYAARIRETLASRVVLERWRPRRGVA